MLKHHAMISQHRSELGWTMTLRHEIHFKAQNPIYVKHFQIPDTHGEEVEKHMNNWWKMEILELNRSQYNSQSLRLVQDFQALNANSHIDKYSMKDVSECIGYI